MEDHAAKDLVRNAALSFVVQPLVSAWCLHRGTWNRTAVPRPSSSIDTAAALPHKSLKHRPWLLMTEPKSARRFALPITT